MQQQILVSLLLLLLGCAYCSPAPDYHDDYQADTDMDYPDSDYDTETQEDEQVTDVSDAQILTKPQTFTVVMGDTVKLPCKTKSSSGKMSMEPFRLMTDKYLRCRHNEDLVD